MTTEDAVKDMERQSHELRKRHQVYSDIVYRTIRDWRDGDIQKGCVTAGTLSVEDTTLLDTICKRLFEFDKTGQATV